MLVPLAFRWKNSMPSNQLEVDGLVCWVVSKGLALACHNMDHRQGVDHTHTIVASHCHYTTALLTGSTLSFSVTLFLSFWQLHYLALSRNMKHRGATSSRWAQQICQFISQPAIWQARLLLLKGIIQAQGCRHQSLLPSFSLSLSHFTFSFPLPPFLAPSPFDTPPPHELVSICRALPLKIEKGSWPATTNLKRTGEEKIPLF